MVDVHLTLIRILTASVICLIGYVAFPVPLHTSGERNSGARGCKVERSGASVELAAEQKRAAKAALSGSGE